MCERHTHKAANVQNNNNKNKTTKIACVIGRVETVTRCEESFNGGTETFIGVHNIYEECISWCRKPVTGCGEILDIYALRRIMDIWRCLLDIYALRWIMDVGRRLLDIYALRRIMDIWKPSLCARKAFSAWISRNTQFVAWKPSFNIYENIH